MSPPDEQNDFDLVAPIYDALARVVFAGSTFRAQRALLPHVRDRRTFLVVGGGTGWFLRELLVHAPHARVLYIEKSAKMLEYARALIEREAPARAAQVEFRLGTEESLGAADGPFDVIVTNFLLDNFADDTIACMTQRLSAHLAAGGRWLFVDWEVPRRGPMRWYAKAVFKVMFTFFRVLSRIESREPPDFERVFARLELRAEIAQTFYGGAIQAKLLARKAQGTPGLCATATTD